MEFIEKFTHVDWALDDDSNIEEDEVSIYMDQNIGIQTNFSVMTTLAQQRSLKQIFENNTSLSANELQNLFNGEDELYDIAIPKDEKIEDFDETHMDLRSKWRYIF